MKTLTQTASDILVKERASVYEDLLVNGVSCKSYLRSASYNYGRDFAAASAKIVLSNPGGRFSDGGTNPINRGDEIIVIEGQYLTDGSLEIYSGFTGIVRRRQPSLAKDSTISVECTDYITKLADTDIDYTRSGTKVSVTGEELSPNFIHYLNEGTGTYVENYIEDTTKSWTINSLAGLWLVDYNNEAWPVLSNTATKVYVDTIRSGFSGSHAYSIGEGLAQVFDMQHSNICSNPIPNIVVRNNADEVRAYSEIVARDQLLTEWDGFQVKYENGQVVLGIPIDAVNYRIEADYSYYDQGIYAEDIIEDIITRTDGYGDTIFTSTDNLTAKFTDQSRASYDSLTPNYAPDTDPDVADVLHKSVTVSDTELYVRSGHDFYAPSPADQPAYLQVNQEIIGYEGKSDTIFSGLTRGVLGTIAQTHSKNDNIYQVYPARQLWFTSYNNLTETPSITGFEVVPNILTKGDDTSLINFGTAATDVYFGQQFQVTEDCARYKIGVWLKKTEATTGTLYCRILQNTNPAPILYTASTTLNVATQITTDFQYFEFLFSNARISAGVTYVFAFTRGSYNILKYLSIQASNTDVYNPYLAILATGTRSLTFAGPVCANFKFFKQDYERDWNNRYGRLTLKEILPTGSTIQLNNDYTFKTLQATGIQINEISLREREFKTRIDAIKRVRDFIAPNYVIRTEGDKKIWGSYLNQDYTEDYTLHLVENLNYDDEEGTYTRVRLYGQNNSPTNLVTENSAMVIDSQYWYGDDGICNGLNTYDLPSETFTYNQVLGYNLIDNEGKFYKIYGNHATDNQTLIISGMPADGNYKVGRYYVGETYNHPLKFEGVNGNNFIYTSEVGIDGKVITNYPLSPKIKINGVQLDLPEPTAVGPVPVKKITDISTILTITTTSSGQSSTSTAANTFAYIIKFPHTDIVSDIYTASDGGIDSTDDIFIYLVGHGGGGIRASIQFFSSSDDVVKYVAGGYADVGQLDPLFTIPVNDPNVDYRQGYWRVTGIPSYSKVYNSLYSDATNTDTEIYFLVQKFYEDYRGAIKILPTIDSGTITYSVPPGSMSSTAYGGYGNGRLDAYMNVDLAKNWTDAEVAANNWAGYVLIDANGREFAISDRQAPNRIYGGGTGGSGSSVGANTGSSGLGAYKVFARVTGWDGTDLYVYDYQYDSSQWIDAATTLRNEFYTTPTGGSLTTGASSNFKDDFKGWLGAFFANVVPEEFPAFSAYLSAQGRTVSNNNYYSAVTGRKIYEAMRFGGASFDDPTLYPGSIVTVDNKEPVAYTGLSKVREWEEIHDLRETFNGNNVTARWNGPTLGSATSGLPKDYEELALACGYRIRIVNQVWQLTGCSRGAFGTTPDHHYTTYHDNKFAAVMDGPLLVQKHFYYKNFVAGAQITDLDNIGSAIYYVWHKNDGKLDYSVDPITNKFLIDKTFFSDTTSGTPSDTVTADFVYAKRLVPINNWHNIFDGKYDTQSQMEFLSEPLPGTEVFTVDFGSVISIDAIDMLAGYFALEGANTGMGQIAFTNSYTLKYSTDNLTYLLPTDKAQSFSLASGSTFSLERDDLGVGFQARYIKLEIEKCQKLNYDNGRWFVAITDFRAWANTVLVGAATLVTRLDHGTAGVGTLNTMTDSTKSWTVNAYTGKWLVDVYDNEFYISSNTATALTVSGTPNSGEYWIFDAQQSTTTVYDKDNLKVHLGDKLYKVNQINNRITKQTTINKESKEYLKEFIKNHSKLNVTVAFHPALRVGQTVKVIDATNNVNRNYFIEGISKDGYKKTLALGYYP